MSEQEHPALKGYSRMWEMAKHIGGSAIKSAAKWAAVGVVVLGAIALLPAAAAGVLSTLTFGLSSWLVGSGTGLLIGAVGNGLMFGAAAGALVGGLSSVASAGEAADQVADERVAAYERGEVRQIRIASMQQKLNPSMAQGAGYGVSAAPNLPLNQKSSELGMG